MKRLIGRLPVNCKYEVISIEYKPQDGDNYMACDNCGKIISNIAIVKNDAGVTYGVGLDCAGTMQLYCNDAVFDLIEAKKKLARRAKFVKWFKTKHKSHIIDSGEVFLYEHPVTEWRASYTYRMSQQYFIKTYPYLKLKQ